MKKGAMILGIVGGVLSLLLGMKWISDASGIDSIIEMLGEDSPIVAELNSLVNAAYAMVLFGVVAIAVAAMPSKLPTKAGAGVLVACGLIPAIFATKALATGVFIIIAGLLTFFSKEDPMEEDLLDDLSEHLID